MRGAEGWNSIIASYGLHYIYISLTINQKQNILCVSVSLFTLFKIKHFLCSHGKACGKVNGHAEIAIYVRLLGMLACGNEI